MRNGGFWFKVKVLSFKIRFCNGDSDAHLTPTTAHAQTLAASFNWTEMRQLFYGTILLMMFSCDMKSSDKDFVEYVDGRQLLTVNEIKRNGDSV